jgi:integrase
LTSARVGHFLLTRRDRLPIDKFNTHDLRRTVATMLAEMGQPLDLVATVIGDEAGGKNTRTLVRHYVRTDLIERKLHMLRLWDERLQTSLPVALHPMCCTSSGQLEPKARMLGFVG